MLGRDMDSAEQVAAFLAYQFLRQGNYTAAVGPIEVPDLASAVAAADEGEEDVAMGYLRRAAPFGGLSVQSVGFEEGVKDPKVHIFT
jgi:hypothetical protein